MSKGQLQRGRNADWDLDEFTREALVKAKELQIRYEKSGNVGYLGKANFGALTSEATWQVRKIDFSSGVVMTAADGDANFDNVWDDRAGLTYS